MDKRFYLKATGVNRFVGGGSWQWLKIRGFKAMKDKNTGKESYELEVKTRWGIRYMLLNDFNPANVIFKDETDMPVSFVRVIKHFKDRGIGLLIS